MASWWIPWRMLELLRAIHEGRQVMTDGKDYWVTDGGNCAPQAKGLLRRGLISEFSNWRGGNSTMRITPTGLNTLRSHSGLTKGHYEK